MCTAFARRLVPVVVAIVCLCSLAAPARAAEEAAVSHRIPNGPTARSTNDYYKLVLAFGRRALVEAYRQRGARDPAWDAKAVQFLDTWARRHSSDGTVTLADLVSRGKLMRYNAWWWDSAHAGALYRFGRYAEAKAFVAKAGADFAETAFSPLAGVSLAEAKAKLEAPPSAVPGGNHDAR